MAQFIFRLIMRFSPYGLIPDTEVIAREYDLQPLKTEYIPNLKRELKPGWLMPYLYNIDSMVRPESRI